MPSAIESESTAAKSPDGSRRRRNTNPLSMCKPKLGITRRNFHTMRSRAFRTMAAILTVSLLAATPAYAGPVAISEVVQVLSIYQNPPAPGLRSVVQNSNAVAYGSIPDSVLSGLAVNSDQQQVGVVVIDQ